MPVYDLYSKRLKLQRGDAPDGYKYDEISENLRTQIVHIWVDALVARNPYSFSLIEPSTVPYEAIVKVLKREYGVFGLVKNHTFNTPQDELIGFFLSEKDTDKILDTIELSFVAIDRSTRSISPKLANDAIEELNKRFLEHGVGYEFTNSQIIRKDSELIHAEVVKPALKLLNTKEYAGPQQEFLNAFDHFKQGKTKEAINEALKAFESTMKAICDKQNWAYNPDKDTSNTLIDICYKNGLIPSFWQDQMKALRKLLESGVPTGRNKMSGHGQGATPKEVPDYMASYILHMTASAIVFLVEAEKAIK